LGLPGGWGWSWDSENPATTLRQILYALMLICLFCAAGVFCAIVSHPADTVVSKLNNDVGSTPIQAARDLGMKGEWSMQTAFNPVGVGFCALYLFSSQ